MTVQEWMTVNPITVGPAQSARTVHEIMRANGVRHVPVVERGRLIGIVTDRDLRSALPWENEGNADRLRVRGVMTGKVFTVSPETRVERAARLMIEKKIGALPVLERASLVGIITTTDFLSALVEGPAGGAPAAAELRVPARVRRLQARRTPRPEAGRRKVPPTRSARST